MTTAAASPTLWRRARNHFDHLVTLSTPERNAALQHIERSDPRLGGMVERLLAQDRTDEFLELPLPSSLGGFPRLPGAGDTLGTCRLLREIGRGGSGVVFLAQRAETQPGEGPSLVATKILSRTLCVLARRRFERECRILGRLRHPHIAQRMGDGTTPRGLPYIVMEWIDGEPLTAHCDRRRLSIEARLTLFGDLCAAVAHAHRQGIIHQDLKPNNILVTKAGRVKLLDFGSATFAPGAPHAETSDEIRCLTLSYASPEQVLGHPITPATDIYSLGVLLYELLCGRLPHGTDRPELFGLAPPLTPPSRAWEGQPTPGLSNAAAARGLAPEDLRQRLKGCLDELVLRALRRLPGERWESVGELRAAL